MLKLIYIPEEDSFGDLPDLQEITMTLSENASFESASREFCTFLMASGYKPPQGWGSTQNSPQDEYESGTEREWVGITDDDYEAGAFYIDSFLEGVDWAEAKLKEKNT